MRVAVLDDYVGAVREFADWDSLAPGVEVTVFTDAIPPAAVTSVLAPFDGVVVMRERTRFSREVISALPNLKLIVTNGPHNGAVDAEAAREAGIVFCGTVHFGGPGWAGPEVPGVQLPAEMAWALIFAVTKRIVTEDTAVRAGRWGTGYPATLRGMTLGLAGAGRLGAQMVEPARAFGMDVMAWSPNLTKERTDELGVRLVTKEELCATTDVLGIFIRLSERSRGLIGREELARMRRGSYLINISRGPIVDETALIDALASGQLAGAGLDVYDTEPLPLDHPLRALPNVVLMPHLGYVSEPVFRKMYAEAVEDIAAFVAGAPIREIT